MYNLKRGSHMKSGKKSNFELTLHVGQAPLHPEASVRNTALQIFYVFCKFNGGPGEGLLSLRKSYIPKYPLLIMKGDKKRQRNGTIYLEAFWKELSRVGQMLNYHHTNGLHKVIAETILCLMATYNAPVFMHIPTL